MYDSKCCETGAENDYDWQQRKTSWKKNLSQNFENGWQLDGQREVERAGQARQILLKVHGANSGNMHRLVFWGKFLHIGITKHKAFGKRLCISHAGLHNWSLSCRPGKVSEDF
jgi:hypothetical protein